MHDATPPSEGSTLFSLHLPLSIGTFVVHPTVRVAGQVVSAHHLTQLATLPGVTTLHVISDLLWEEWVITAYNPTGVTIKNVFAAIYTGLCVQLTQFEWECTSPMQRARIGEVFYARCEASHLAALTALAIGAYVTWTACSILPCLRACLRSCIGITDGKSSCCFPETSALMAAPSTSLISYPVLTFYVHENEKVGMYSVCKCFQQNIDVLVRRGVINHPSGITSCWRRFLSAARSDHDSIVRRCEQRQEHPVGVTSLEYIYIYRSHPIVVHM